VLTVCIKNHQNKLNEPHTTMITSNWTH